ncbi:EscT/YscT/HrcT family type III secretion system export apparatus protein [Simkania sp.]|uniref:EscT/YscT/HrcT family type III secretion system export apparatus protein n=1 Tax=Simkania sp. TaxID=34094 RepID=UPI003B52D32D
MSLFMLAFMRMAPIVMLAPFLGAKTAPVMARTGLAIFMSILFLPIIAQHAEPPYGFSMGFLLYCTKELLVGFFLGFLISVPFFMVQSSGIIIDYLRGASIMQSQDPSMQSQSSPIGILYNFIMITVFFNVQGPFLFFEGIATSYEIIPADSFINPAFFSMKIPFWQVATDLVNKLVAIAIQLASPCLVAILMAEMFLGIANRLAPQVQIAFLGMSIKSLLGLMLLWAGWFFILKQFSSQSFSWLDTMDKLIQNFHYLVPKTSV